MAQNTPTEPLVTRRSLLIGSLLLPALPALLTTGCGGSSKHSASVPDLKAIVAATRSESEVPALAVAYITLDHVYTHTVGVRRSDSTEAVTLDDRWQIGSTTKSMTATIAGRLVEEGKIGWDTTVSQVFPSFANTINASFKDVTLEQFLFNRGGVMGLLGLDDILALPTWTGTNREQRFQFVQYALAQTPEAPVGELVYSNGNFSVAGAMLEAAANDTWENLLETRVLGKVGAHPTYGAPLLSGANQPWGHLEDGDTFTPYDARTGYYVTPFLYPAGGVCLSIGDFAQYVQAHLRGVRGYDGLVKAATFTRLHTPSNNILPGYALGWIEFLSGGQRVSYHDGSDDTFYAIMGILPESGRAAIALTNSGGDHAIDAATEAVSAVLDTTFDLSSLENLFGNSRAVRPAAKGRRIR